MKEALSIIKEIQNTSSRNEKEEILKLYKDNKMLRLILNNVYNPYIIFGIKDKKLNKFLKVSKGGSSKFSNLEEVFSYLSKNNTGTDAVVKEVAEYLMTEYDEEIRQYLFEIITKKLRIGATAKSINKAFGEQFIPEFNLMLAKKFEDEEHKLNNIDFILTEKLDGVRAVIIVDKNSVKIFSRQGLPILELNEIINDANNLPNGVYDGELLIVNADDYKDRDVLQETLKIVRRDGIKSGLTFHCFDYLTLDEFDNGKSKYKYKSRREFIEQFIDDDLGFSFIKVVPVLYKGDDLTVIPELLEEMNSKGKEGLMLNLADELYECKRSSSLLKIKTMMTFDGKVIGFEEGDGKYKGMLGKVIVDYKGFKLGCGSGFTDEDRVEIWNNQDHYIHKIAEIQYFRESKSQDGNLSVSFPVFKQWRFDKDEPSFH